MLIKVTSAKTMDRGHQRRQSPNRVREEKERVELDGRGYQILNAQNLGMIGFWIRRREISRLVKILIDTSILAGPNYLEEVLQSKSPNQVREALPMPLSTLQQLCTELAMSGHGESTVRVFVEE